MPVKQAVLTLPAGRFPARTATPTRGLRSTALWTLLGMMTVPIAASAQTVAVPGPTPTVNPSSTPGSPPAPVVSSSGVVVPVQVATQPAVVTTPTPPTPPTPRWSSGNNWLPLASVRFAVGPSFSLGNTGGGAIGTSFDAGAGVRLVHNDSSAVAPVFGVELGYSWLSNVAQGFHGARFGGSIGFRHGASIFAWTPQMVVGNTTDGTLGIGLRNGLFIGPLGGILGVELSHQYLNVSGSGLHSIQGVVSLDVGTLTHAFVVLLGGLGCWPTR